MNRNTYRAAGAAAALLALGIWACKAPPVPGAGRSELWDQVHGRKAAPAPGPVASRAATNVVWKGELVFSETEKDLGDVERGEEAKHRFTITNKTDQVLHVKNVRGS